MKQIAVQIQQQIALIKIELNAAQMCNDSVVLKRTITQLHNLYAALTAMNNVIELS